MSDSARRVAEIDRLRQSPPQGAKPGGLGTVRFIARCPFGADAVLQRVKELLLAVDEATIQALPEDSAWLELLPAWFVDACGPALTPAQAIEWQVRWESLAPAARAREQAESIWSVDEWIYWMKPGNRYWWWWDGQVVSDTDHIYIAVEVDEWPFPWDALRWAFRAAGASALEAEK